MTEAGVEAVVADALALCAIAAPTFAEGPRADAVAARLRDTGLQPSRDAAGNVLVAFGPEATAQRPACVVTAHLDTVFAAGTDLSPHRDGDRLHGPGIGDDALGLAALLHLARRFAAAPSPPARPVVLAFTVCEEGLGDLRGANAVLDAVPCDAFVALEGHGLEVIQTAGIGSSRLIVLITGPGGHSWGDRGTPSAVDVLLDALDRARRVAAGAHCNIGVLRGGTSINTIAASAEAELDLRDADDATLRARTGRVVAALQAGPPAPGITIAVEQVGARPGGITPPGHPLVAAARRARTRAGLPPATELSSSTDANAAMGRGIAAISVSLTTGAHAHRADEHVDLGPLPGGLHALEELLDALGAGAPTPGS